MKASTKQLPLTIPADEIAAFCRRHHIRELALFGSVLRDDFGPALDKGLRDVGSDETGSAGDQCFHALK